LSATSSSSAARPVLARSSQSSVLDCNLPELFASVIVSALFGVVIFVFFGWLRRRAVGKWYDVS